MELLYKERFQMIMMLMILERIDIKNRNDYEVYREILEKGYKEQYEGWYFDNIDKEELEIDESQFVWEVLEMYDNIAFSYENLVSKATLTEKDIKFPGFDGNNEAKLSLYAQFVVEKLERFKRIKRYCNNNYDSHTVMTDIYNRMIAIYVKIPLTSKSQMTFLQISELLNA